MIDQGLHQRLVVYNKHLNRFTNASKTKAMAISTSMRLKQLDNTSYIKIQDNLLEFVKHYNYLGIILDNEMSLTPLVNNIKGE